jgi:phosphatidate cytidylyltransferase
MVRRLGTALLLLILIVPAVVFGGIFYFLLVAFFIVTATYEYVHMFGGAGFRPWAVLTIGGSLLLLALRAFWSPRTDLALTLLVLLAMAYHMLAYERGRDEAALDFVITIGGLVYLGWVAGYILEVRALPHGAWWVMFIFPVVWLADSGAYLIGARYGTHKMLKRLSPKKSWEGFFAGVLIGTLYGGFFAFAYTRFGPLHLAIWQGLLLGFVLSSITTLGDLGESLIKRFTGAKDSGTFLPGHGGAFDRIDSLIWAAVIGVTWIQLFHL